MSSPNRSKRLLLALTFFFASLGSAHAQCLTWGHGFGTSQVSGRTIATFDDGTGPALCVANNSSVWRWKNSTWSQLGSGMSGGYSGPIIFTLAVFDDGTGPALYAGGLFTHADGVSASAIARWNGTNWTDVGGGLGGLSGQTRVHALAVFDDGTGPALYAGGEFSTAGGVNAAHIAKWNGSNWSSVGGGVASLATAFAVCDDGSGPALFLYEEGSNQVDKWNGSYWSYLGSGISGLQNPLAFCTYDDGTGPAIYAAGAFNILGASHVAKWNGSSWISVGNGPDCCASALAVFDDGSGKALFAGGTFMHVGGASINGVARWNGSTWSATGNTLGTFVQGLTVFDDGHGPALCGVGQFPGSGSACQLFVAKWTGSQWVALPGGNGVGGTTRALRAFDDGNGASLFAGGDFDVVGATCVSSVAAWSGSSWRALGTGLNFGVHAFAIFDDGYGSALYAGGLSSAGSVGIRGVAKWNGSTWTGLGRGIIGGVDALCAFDDGSGAALYAGGSFTAAGNVSAHSIARWDGFRWTALGIGVDGGSSPLVDALAVFDDGSGPALYVGGSFALAGGTSASNIARWDGSLWTGVGGGTNNYVSSLCVFDDGAGLALYAGGNFTSAGGVSANHIAKWNGSNWSALASGLGNGSLESVATLSVFDDGSGRALHAGGSFVNAGATQVNGIARWNGSTWTAFSGGITNSFVNPSPFVSAMAEFTDANDFSNLFVGGSFSQAGNGPSFNIAEWRGCLQIAQPFCSGDGSATNCPCSNDSATGHHEGCRNSLGLGGALRASGHASLAHDMFVLSGAQMPNAPCLYFQGTTQLSGGLGVVFGDGLRCVGGSVIRLGTKTNSAGTSQYPTAGDLPISVRGLVMSPGVRTYQAWYRNAAAFCTSSTFNLTNGVQITWAL